MGTFPWAPYIETNTTFPGNDWYEEWRQDDWRFLPDFPEKLYRQRKFSPKLRVLAGANRDEAAFFVCEWVSCWVMATARDVATFGVSGSYTWPGFLYMS